MRTLTRSIATSIHHAARAHIRLPAFGRATLRRWDAPDVPIRIGNISRAGFMGETDAPLRAGMVVQLVLPSGRVEDGIVRWCLNGRFGCKLDGAFRQRDMLTLSALAGVRLGPAVLLAALLALLLL
jgi:hypothetical protein